MGRAAILGWIDDQPQAAVRRIDVDDLEIGGTGSFAWKLATFRAIFEAPADGGRVVTRSHAWLLQRDDAGVWHVSVVTWTILDTAKP